MICRILTTPLGEMTAQIQGGVLTRLTFGAAGDTVTGTPEEETLLQRLCAQLEEYAHGQRQDFDLPLNPVGTPFQRQVWEALLTIPYGQRRSYGEIAAQIGRPGAARAVGAACGKNPILVVIPCHRVVGKNGALTGYSAQGGVARKDALLEMEQNR